MVNVRQVVVEKNGDSVLKDNVVVKKVTVELLQNSVRLKKDVNTNLVNV